MKLRKISEITATNKLRRRLLGLLSKQIGQWNRICEIHTIDIVLIAEQSKRLSAIKEVFRRQIDGISFIEHHSFEAFNEGVRLKECIEY